jgi:tRNA nucleotidyltransferase (CCA-adding enzyme)
LIGELENAGYTAYIVGGSVRDAVMGKSPNDYDICTSASPEQMKTVFQ